MSEKPPYRVAHHAEAFRQGYEQYGTLRWGWHCLTCNAEQYVPTLQAAEEGAAAHSVPSAQDIE
jgi:hypothetical protein